MTTLSPQETAERSSATMLANDAAAHFLGIQLGEIGPGTATTTMLVGAQHLNGHNICHGGFIFTLADSAFAFACNSHNQIVVAQHNTISFVSPGKQGETLTATATETSRVGRSGIYDVTVTNENGRVIAEFRGCSRVIQGQHFDENEEQT